MHLEKFKISTPESPYFAPCWTLYNDAFVKEERRSEEYQMATFLRNEYSFEAIVIDGQHVGFIASWELGEWQYIEHFAIFEQFRNGGFGAKVIAQIVATATKQVILEVEPPTNLLTQRRIEFYKRMGFHLNNTPYTQPSYWGEPQSVDLKIMSYPTPLNDQQINHFAQICHTVVHFR